MWMFRILWPILLWGCSSPERKEVNIPLEEVRKKCLPGEKSLKKSWNDIGLCHLYSKNFDLAEFYFFKATYQTSKKEKAMAFNNMGTLYAQREKYKKALHFFEKAIEVKPDYFMAKVNLAGIYIKFSQYDLAHKILANMSPAYKNRTLWKKRFHLLKRVRDDTGRK